MLEPGKEKFDRYEIGLDCKEFAAIGHAVVHWSLLENAMLQATTGLAEVLGVALPDDARKIGFQRRLNAYRSVVEQIPNPDARTYHDKLIQRISNANGQRQTLVHGIWDYDASGPDFLIVENAGTGAKPRLIDIDKVIAFSHEVGRLTLEILYPGGMTVEDVADRAQYGMSRDFLRSVIHKK